MTINCINKFLTQKITLTILWLYVEFVLKISFPSLKHKEHFYVYIAKSRNKIPERHIKLPLYSDRPSDK